MTPREVQKICRGQGMCGYITKAPIFVADPTLPAEPASIPQHDVACILPIGHDDNKHEPKAFVVKGDDLVEITDKVAVIYNALVPRLFGFLDDQDIDAVLDIGDLLGFTIPSDSQVPGREIVSRVLEHGVSRWRARKAAADAAAVADKLAEP